VKYLNKCCWELIIINTKELNEIIEIIIKNLGQMYLKKILASVAFISLFIAGASSTD